VAYLRYHDRGVLYSVSAGLGIGDAGRVSVLVRATAAVAALIAFALIRALQTRAFVSLQLSQVRAAVAARGRAVIDDVYPLAFAVGCGVPSPFAPPAPVCRTVNWVGAPGVVHRLDRRRFVDAAIDADALVVSRVGVGDSLHEASPLAETYRGDVPDQVVRAAVVRGVDRSFDQDPMLAVRLLADIGLRALSPAVNDPATSGGRRRRNRGLVARAGRPRASGR
jgi:uncharacterized membrane protein